ncbi:MAG: acetyl-CoA carboxylase biotin carboxylase subunit [Bacteroidia bacterium]|nr:acetyl-CoA carboxylase biotin carboxylase subunit [Bacteroidia bacterium]
MFSKILIANRGEIAVRVIRTCREMGIKTVAVYSEADADAMHVRMADESYCIGTAASADSYLRMDKIIDVCKKSGAEAVHPGYGFLSENAVFARALKEAGIVFIGPSAESIELMGSKIASKQAVANFGVPLVPGINAAITDPMVAEQTAVEIGFPVLIKASAGGGGKGMRVVNNRDEFMTALNMAQSEARNSFGNDDVFIEKYVLKPRHIEIQVLADSKGNGIHLFERECSIQRRHQKLVEEAPSGILTPELRNKMGEAAVNVAKACNYQGAGTVEFLLDSNMNFYFLEMNTRLQVEHPVTEMITGLDLVREQIRVAAGLDFSFNPDELKINGHAIELRICAEDPYENFLPDTGQLSVYRIPKGPGVRVDDCMEEGMTIPIFYDNMFAKLVVWAQSRELAIERMKRAISEFEINGVATTLPFGEFVMNHPDFINADFDTAFIAKNFSPDKLISDNISDELLQAAAIAAVEVFNQRKTQNHGQTQSSVSNGSKWYKNRKE